MIKFHDCYSTVNDTGWWSASCTCARATVIGAFLVKESALLNLNIAISTILAQGSAIKQCRPLVNEDFLRWVAEKKFGRLVFVSLCVCVSKHFRE